MDYFEFIGILAEFGRETIVAKVDKNEHWGDLRRAPFSSPFSVFSPFLSWGMFAKN
jgi:hypothetical protein